ncbi:class I SAM-dependent methyltransferase [Vibrio aquimaris]|uniref:Putative methyltransferase YcgJ n=1 Tax=Vibrio aquimaris TaxID=2587862 RepID=A0A5P9CFT2_9VIBR|nr:class I SAM-dependent methyltransferase [Vibrio aquimaris]QFT24921.1 putative methyltransferase YcgJ [Vibrio aquimaris]
MTLFRDPTHYSENSVVQKSEASYLIDKADINFASKKLLDVGSGDGKLSALMSNMGAEVTGIDISESMVNFSTHNYPNCRFFQGDAQDLTKHAINYNIITSFNCLHWISDIERVLSGIKAKLEKDGIFLGLIYPRCVGLWDAADWCENLPEYKVSSKLFVNPYCFHTKSDMENLLTQVGFTNIKLWEEERQTTFQTKEEFKGYIMGWLPHYHYYGQSFIKPWLHKYMELTDQMTNTEVTMEYKTIFFIAS